MRTSWLTTLALGILMLAATAWAGGPSLEWANAYDGGPGMNDEGTALLVDPDGDLIVGGESTDEGGTSDMFIRKLSRSDGSEIWSARWEEPGGNDMALVEMAFDPIGNIIVAGYIRGCAG